MCVFVIDTPGTLGYTLAGFRHVRAIIHFAIPRFRAPVIYTIMSRRSEKVIILFSKEVDEWLNQ